MHDGGWGSLIGLFVLAVLLAFLTGVGGLIIGKALVWLVGLGLSIDPGQLQSKSEQQHIQVLASSLRELVPTLLGAVGGSLGLIWAANLKTETKMRTFLRRVGVIKWRQFALGAVLDLVIKVLVSGAIAQVMILVWPDFFAEDTSGAPFEIEVQAAEFILFMLVLIPFVWLQTGAEELAYRGAWLQQFGSLRGSWIVAVFATSFIFALGHSGSPLPVLIMIGLHSVGWSYAVLRFGNLSYGWGAHFSNNLFIFTLFALVSPAALDISEINNRDFGGDLKGTITIIASLVGYVLLAGLNILAVRYVSRAEPMPEDESEAAKETAEQKQPVTVF